MAQQTPSMWSELARLWAIRGMEGESRIVEEWKDIVASRHTVRVRQWLGATAGLLATFLGLAGIGVPIAQAGGFTSTLDVALAGTVAALMALVIAGLTAWLLRDYGARGRVIGALAGTLCLAAVILTALRLGEPLWWHPVAAVIGVCLLGPSLAFTYNQSVDLVDPMGWVSAFERRMAPHLDEILEASRAQPQDEPTERVVIINAAKAQNEMAQAEEQERASQFKEFVANIPVRGTSMGAWESELGRDLYREYRDALIKLRWARWRSVREDGSVNETQGWVLARPVEEILERIRG